MPSGSTATMRETRWPPTVAVDGRQITARSSSSRPETDTKSSWPPMPENCRPSSVSATTWPHRSMASAPLMVTISSLREIVSGELTMSTGQEPHLVVAVEPLVELGGAGGERGDRVPVELPLAAVRHLARLVQLHQPGREHLGVHAEVAGVAVGQQLHDHRRDPADAGLQRRADRMNGRTCSAIAVSTRWRLGVGEEERGAVGLDHEVDLVDVHAVREAPARRRTYAGRAAMPRRSATRSGSAMTRWSSTRSRRSAATGSSSRRHRAAPPRSPPPAGGSAR